MKRSFQGVMLATAFIATQVLAGAGCNAILGNGYGVDDGTNGGLGPDGGNVDPDAPLNGGEGGPGSEGGGPGVDGSTTADGSTDPDVNVDAAACPRQICPVMLTTATAPQRLALGSAFVYWSTATGVGRVGLDGTASKFTVVGAPVVSTVKRGVAVAPNGTAYVTVTDRGGAICASDLSSCSTNGMFIGSAGDSSSIAADAAKVYVGIYDGQTGSGKGGIWQTSPTGASAAPYTNALFNVVELRVQGPNTYFMSTTGVHYTPSLSSMSVSATDVSGAPVAFDVSGQVLAEATKTNAIHVCKTSPTLACPTDLVQQRGATITAIAVDGLTIIWGEIDATGAGAIYRSGLSPGSAVELLAENQGKPVAIAVDLKGIYWATPGGGIMGTVGGIMRLGK